MNILDCTIRDGGYYTNWDFDRKLVLDYCKLVKSLPIDIIEIGYRGNKNKESYFGEYYFLTINNLKKIKSAIGKTKKIAIMIDLKDWKDISDLKKNLSECRKIVEIVRFAVDPKKIDKAKKFLKVTKELGFKVAINLMYSHLLIEKNKYLEKVINLKKYFDVIYIVDSYGTLITGDVQKIIQKIKTLDSNIPIGFHAHNNLEMALSNTLEAINNKINYIDCTLTGMGRGAGNLKTELLLTYLNLKNKKIKINDYKNLANVVDQFEEIKLKQKWGTSLPYMISGSTASPQAKVMQLIQSKRYELTDIVNFLSHKKKNQDNIQKNTTTKKNNVLIIGGGSSVIKNLSYIKDYLSKNSKTFLIFSSSRNLSAFTKIKNKALVCITGNETRKIHKKYFLNNKFIVNNIIDDKTILPNKVKNFYKLKKKYISEDLLNSPLSIALSTALEIKAKKIFLIGFDGYKRSDKINDYNLYNENQKILNFFKKKLKLIFFTETSYENIKKSSIFKYLS